MMSLTNNRAAAGHATTTQPTHPSVGSTDSRKGHLESNHRHATAMLPAPAVSPSWGKRQSH
ncbi:hypothetical protein C2845_PM09G10820 [Panicum miliaceum]|uniref:Uncharacterized protein n=1 Tax=Panicum miliaceum TaxID=4540 RepID=A0A3L6S0S6_PANMI|nr:hypothetical protein C2845_PM09G10820 [Panicum miliaceum]